ncbi:MAG: hypothetical protein ABEN55_20260, partial [Bradymonadaceae bacterium]
MMDAEVFTGPNRIADVDVVLWLPQDDDDAIERRGKLFHVRSVVRSIFFVAGLLVAQEGGNLHF